MSREYYLHKRNGIFYVEFINPENGKKMTARSTGKTDQIEAHVQAKQWIANGIATGRGGVTQCMMKLKRNHN